LSAYVDDGHFRARLDRPGLDSLRDAVEAGLIEAVWCLEINQTHAVVVRRILDEYVTGGRSIRHIVGALNDEGVPAAAGGRWHHSTVGHLLRNEAYVGRLYWNQTESVPDPRPARHTRQVPRPKDEWISIPGPAIVDDDTFEAVQRACRDNIAFSARRPRRLRLRSAAGCAEPPRGPPGR
jgi:hypothetical protein